MLGLQLLVCSLLAFRLILVLVCGLAGLREETRQTFVLALKTLCRCLRIRDLRAKLLESDLKVPVLLLELVCRLLLFPKS